MRPENKACAEFLKQHGIIAKVRYADWGQQKKFVPGLSEDHSGNTFGAACNLAILSLAQNGSELVERQHAALCPLVGCRVAGCYSTVASKEGLRA